MSALLRITDSSRTLRHVRKVPQPDSCTATKWLLDHFVGGGEQRRWQFEAKRLRGLKIDDKFKFSGLLDRQIRRLDPLEHLPDIDARFSVDIGEVRAIAC